MAKHIYMDSTTCTLYHYEKGRGCPVCDGGVNICGVCGLGEGSLTTDCPEVKVGQSLGAAIYNQFMDYKDGEWVVTPLGQVGWSGQPSPKVYKYVDIEAFVYKR